ncbi:hypothetical protein [Caloramator sp. Dgby_cultured_2]|uniref:hypothetical protein n=1 Tax=Caloramator sp. Dgby_cultured_2 TaxID=3029174 RepID=UPI00237E9466|nr:hypothetical protein [Caloramator sp. Dgby_cultured_2]WDU84231.1 hypothetical protein PWK10_07910 [Caloramator sp. Dgby_cultured_2]
MDLHNVKQQVEFILQNYPETRNDDKKLTAYVLKEFYNVESIDDICKPEIPCLESIRRCRQKLQEQGKYQGAERIKKRRTELKEVYKEFALTKE